MMIPPISSIRSIEPASGTASSTAAAGGRAADPFREMFQSAVSDVARFQEQAAQSADRFLSGEGEEIHKVALDAQRAELSFDLFLQARNKVVDAYQEIMRMQL
jgi:flagellar hook-basal body complex protein FliE